MRQLGQLEAVVMDRLWAEDAPLSVREVLEMLPQDRSRAYTTVMTVLDNLHRKGFVTRQMQGRAYRYRAARTREQHTAEMLGEVLSGTDDRGAVLMHFVEQMSADEAAGLRSALDSLETDGPAR